MACRASTGLPIGILKKKKALTRTMFVNYCLGTIIIIILLLKIQKMFARIGTFVACDFLARLHACSVLKCASIYN